MTYIPKHAHSVWQWHDKLAEICEMLDNSDLSVKDLRRLALQVETIRARSDILSIQQEYERDIHAQRIDRRLEILDDQAHPKTEGT